MPQSLMNSFNNPPPLAFEQSHPNFGAQQAGGQSNWDFSFNNRLSNLGSMPPIPDMDGLDDMELDTSAGTNQNPEGLGLNTQNMNLLGNPTVSSVNTPTLGTNLPGFGGHAAGDSSSGMMMGGMRSPSTMRFGGDLGLGQLDSMTINNPGTQLNNSGPNGSQLLMAATRNPAQSNSNVQPPGQSFASLNFPVQPSESKKYKCPVLGCEKAYKNQNGLKYHRQVRLSSFS